MFYLVFGFLLGVATIIFALQNTAVVALTFLTWQFESSLALLIILVTATGVVVGILASVPTILRQSFYARALRKQIQGLKDEVVTIEKQHNETASRLASATATTPPETIDLRAS